MKSLATPGSKNPLLTPEVPSRIFSDVPVSPTAMKNTLAVVPAEEKLLVVTRTFQTPSIIKNQKSKYKILKLENFQNMGKPLERQNTRD